MASLIVTLSLILALSVLLITTGTIRADYKGWPVFSTVEIGGAAFIMASVIMMFIGFFVPEVNENLYSWFVVIPYSLSFFVNALIAAVTGIRIGYAKEKKLIPWVFSACGANLILYCVMSSFI